MATAKIRIHTYKTDTYTGNRTSDQRYSVTVTPYAAALAHAADATHSIPIPSVATCTALHEIRLWFSGYWETSEAPPQGSSRKPAFSTHIGSAKVTSSCLRCMIAIRVTMSVETSYPVS